MSGVDDAAHQLVERYLAACEGMVGAYLVLYGVLPSGVGNAVDPDGARRSWLLSSPPEGVLLRDWLDKQGDRPEAHDAARSSIGQGMRWIRAGRPPPERAVVVAVAGERCVSVVVCDREPAILS